MYIACSVWLGAAAEAAGEGRGGSGDGAPHELEVGQPATHLGRQAKMRTRRTRQSLPPLYESER